MVTKAEVFQVRSATSLRPRPMASGRWLAQRRVMFLLRLSLAVVFFWFGLLKLLNLSPVVELLRNTFPLLAASPYLELLGMAEMVIAVGLVVKRLSKPAATLMMLHLLGTLSVALVSPQLIFAPAFPVLTMTGEFVVKNLVLIMAGLMVLSARDP